MVDLRDDMSLGAVERFNPDVFVVDKAPPSVRGELLRAFDFLNVNRPHTRIVFGMRGTVNHAESTQATCRKKASTHLRKRFI